MLSLFPILQERSSSSPERYPEDSSNGCCRARVDVCPSILLLDEPSLGLAPLLARQIFQALLALREQRGLSIILVEHDAQAALSIAARMSCNAPASS